MNELIEQATKYALDYGDLSKAQVITMIAMVEELQKLNTTLQSIDSWLEFLVKDNQRGWADQYAALETLVEVLKR